MDNKLWFSIVFFTFSCVFVNATTDFLKEKPDFMHQCERKSDDFRNCFGKNLQHIFIKWKEGVTGIPNSVPLDPMFVSKFVVIEDSENVAPIAVHIANITVTGLSEAKVNNVSINDKEYNFKLAYMVPSVRLDGTYSAFGQILLLRINTTGKMLMNIVNGQYNIAAKIKLRQRGNFTFFDLKSLQFRVRAIEDLRLNFDNLFNDKSLSDNTNAVFNQNWRMFYQIFKPRIEQEINPVLFKHFKNVFDSVPANFFVADVENNTNDL